MVDGTIELVEEDSNNDLDVDDATAGYMEEDETGELDVDTIVVAATLVVIAVLDFVKIFEPEVTGMAAL